ncbi:MAG TPA: phospholipase C, phosphocholine-specific [Panacibacter sp.]|nr:phospholipase C, phosphocholine-specific [Panacibacter sp.]HNP44997.1 phospholipase C, phosphocholine-specific [Panacibacter sp.]
MTSRRSFLKKAALFSGASGVSQFLPGSIKKAFAIDPAPGTTFMDAEHIVLLMQENRSFDHTFGTLQGVRGFNDPRAIRLANDNPVWLQTNEKGETYAPFHLDIKDTKVTWMGSLPHSWSNQVDARNNGRYDQWLQAKKPGNNDYADMPLTMGYYTRDDIPFYYALADAFTVCDQHFCSSLTGTTPNRLYFWSGTIRPAQNENAQANVWNGESDYDAWVSWKTFPERLEDNGVSWKIYQNELSVDGGFSGEQDAWLANFTDNPIEFFSQFNVKLSSRYIGYIQKRSASIPLEIADAEKQLQAMTAGSKEYDDLVKKIKALKAYAEKLAVEKLIYTKEKYDQLSAYEKRIHEKAFTVNKSDPYYHDLSELKYKDGDAERAINVPKGDVLHQFREDVHNGNLPTVSWIVAPEAFSDHPGSAWFGAWYVSEVMDILTKNPEVWKKTIFILTYDENDGYFDHVPPFVAPNPNDASTGKTSENMNAASEFVSMRQEFLRKNIDAAERRESSIGLGYRVPMVIASPWSRGGYVCSQVFDHTSALQFLEKFLAQKTGKRIVEENITAWRRAICGDLTSVFRPYNGEKINAPAALDKDLFIESIHKAKFKKPPSDYRKLGADEIVHVRNNSSTAFHLPVQEKGIRPANALPYEIYANSQLSADKKSIEIYFEAKDNIFGKAASGVPFSVYLMRNFKQKKMHCSSYAVLPGDKLKDVWPVGDFENGNYHIAVHAPNGFYREFKGNASDPQINIACNYQHDLKTANKLTGNIELHFKNESNRKLAIEIFDHYSKQQQSRLIDANNSAIILFDLTKTHNWYDCTVKINGNNIFEKRYSGRVESGKETFTDPAMGAAGM